ncbi:MAG: dTDP-4-dehydrorhamnose 3,5-epimerase [Candidatus Margulisiibacteriota bacterium]
MQISDTKLPEVKLLKPKIFYDHRGYFYESFEKQTLAVAGITDEFVVDNQSFSSQGTLRGLHYQMPPMAQAKLVRVVYGAVFDVAVDIRKSSPRFKQWVGVTLSADTHDMLYIPPGFAHGFYVLSESAKFVYKCSNYYSKTDEGGILWNDPELNIQWPILSGIDLKLSEKDTVAPSLTHALLFES